MSALFVENWLFYALLGLLLAGIILGIWASREVIKTWEKDHPKAKKEKL